MLAPLRRTANYKNIAMKCPYCYLRLFNSCMYCSTLRQSIDTNLRVPARLRNLSEQDVSPQLKFLIVDRIMQRMSSDVSPVPIQANLVRSRPCTCRLEYPLGDPQRCIGGNDFDAGDPFSCFTTLTSR